MCQTFITRMSHRHRQTTEGAEFWITCKQLAFLSSFSHLQVIQNKRPWCSETAYVTAGLVYVQFWAEQPGCYTTLARKKLNVLNLTVLLSN